MKIIVCPLSEVGRLVEEQSPERVVSLLDPDWPSPYLGPSYAGRHLRLSFHDVHVATWEEEVPSLEQVETLLEFVTASTRDAPLLIHCRAGVGRSPAAALVAACALAPTLLEAELAQALRSAAPFARPNEVLVRLGDAALERQGRLLHALEMTRPITPAEPWAAGRGGVPFELVLP
jgi:predicted protein tyrosine phosphatase